MPLPTPKPPTADGNPPEYNAMKDLAERCAKAEAELERVTADRDNETKWAKQYHDDWVKVREELERVQKREVAMRKVLLDSRKEHLGHLVSSAWFIERDRALQSDAGSDRNQPFTCFSCRDGNTPLYCLNCASDILNK